MREQNCERMASMNVERADMKLPESVDRVGTVAGLPKAIGFWEPKLLNRSYPGDWLAFSDLDRNSLLHDLGRSTPVCCDCWVEKPLTKTDVV